MCCFVRPGVIALTWPEDKSDPQYSISEEAYEILSIQTDAQGRQFEIHKIPHPSPQFITQDESRGIKKVLKTISRDTGDRLSASYINFYTPNNGVVVPGFGDQMDEKARKALEGLFPDRTVITVPARELLLGGGAIHCVVHEVPVLRTQAHFNS